MKAITRFAPSPTGYIHIGNVRSALYPYFVAEKSKRSGEGGSFILRIEDTDQNRYVDGATELIMDVLDWLGLSWDEGPKVGGENGPYFQTERKNIYLEWAKKLINSGRAYADPTSSETIEEYRNADNAAKIPYLYRNHRPSNPPEWREGLPIRFKAEPKSYDWHDEVMGDLHSGPEVLDDIILIKADGLPTYNFAHIIDDYLMHCTHIMRGVEYLPSTPNYLAIYEALGIEMPKIVSLPHILRPDGKKKLGKRDGAKSVTEYRADGILPEAMLNYLACLGWNDGTEQEIYSKDELIDKFSIDRIQNSGARYDEVKLLWMNGQWIRKIADEQGIEALYPRTADFWPDCATSVSNDYKKRVLAIIYDRLKVLSDLRTMTSYFFENPKLDLEMITGNKFLKKLELPELKSLLNTSIDRLSTVASWDADTLQTVLNNLLSETGKKPAELFSLIRLSLSFAPFSPALNLTLEVLGRKTSLARLQAVNAAL